jgi:5-methylcytosine-specific restriction endonuclease McrA
MRGMDYLFDRPGCDLPPAVVKISRGHYRKPTREHRQGWTPRKRDGRRGAADKTGQATRLRMREQIIKRYGPVCHICLANGITDHRAVIDLTLVWPDPRCFTRDHVVPVSMGGPDTIENMAPAHNKCNRDRGNGPIVMADLLGESEEAA